MRTLAGGVLVAALVAACTGQPVGATAVPPSAAISASPEAPITASGPTGWNRGPYHLSGGTYELSWQSDGMCSALYFGIVGADHEFEETPPGAGDVPLDRMREGSRTIENVPPGSYYFNVSGVACRSYTATLTRRP